MLKIIQHDVESLGTMYAPAGDGPWPAIMLLHGSEGAWHGITHRNAVFFAAHGFLAYPFGYSAGGNFWNAGHIINVSLDRTVDALKALKENSLCNGRVGLEGGSRGGEHALLLVSLMSKFGVAPPPDAVAVHAAADVICGAFDSRSFRDRGDPGFRAWDPAKRAWMWKGSSENLLPSTPIEIELYNGPIFFSHGLADSMWSADMTRRLQDRLIAHGRAPEVHLYENEDHRLRAAAQNLNSARKLAFFQHHLAEPRAGAPVNG